jgi:ABC-type multidrug transport system ATPase subunit/ABC-type multidrug transport system permease subunit
MKSPANDSGRVLVESVRTKKGKELLHSMVLDFPQGEIVAIMGPSGGGKSTLLDFITRSIQSNIIAEGDVNLPGPLAYVPQDDRLHGFYTVKKYMEHYARLAGIAKSEERDENIANIIDALGLSEEKDTIVGDIFRRGLSGGQKRRLSIGLEALSNPKNLFLDEPTSGLDSESALAVLKFLKSYASSIPGRRVILTIHQPSSFIWELIDRVVLLSKGRLVYQGPRGKMEDFFEYAGCPTPLHYNPSDHYLAQVNTEFSLSTRSPDEWHDSFMEWCLNNGTQQVMLSQKQHEEYEKKSHCALGNQDKENQNEAGATSHEPSSATDEGYLNFLNFLKAPQRRTSSDHKSTTIHNEMAAVDLHSFRAHGLRAMVELVRRYILNLLFNPGILGTRVAMYVMLALIIGALFWDLGDLTTFTSINSRIALLFYCVAFFVFMSVAVLPFTVMERGIITKEVRNAYYHPMFYQAAQALAAIPGTALLAFLTTIIITQMTGLREPYWYFLNMFLALNCAEALAQLISHIVPHFIIGMALVAGFYGMFMLLQGFMLVPSEFPNWLKWSYNIGFHTYSWRTFMYNEFNGQVFPDADMTGTDILKTYEIEDVDPLNDMLVLIGYAAVIHVFSFAVLWGKHVWHLRSNVNNVSAEAI